MDGRARCVTLALALVLLTGSAVCVAAEDETADPLAGRWEKAPFRGYRAVVEPGGIVWGEHENELRYWDGGEFRKPTIVGAVEASSSMQFAGGPDRGAYVVFRGGEPHVGHVCELCDGEARHVTDIYCEDPVRASGLYVSPSGRLINWGKRFIATRRDGEWHRVEASLKRNRMRIVETGDTVHFYSQARLHSVGPDGRVVIRSVPDLVPVDEERGSPQVVPLGKDSLLIAHSRGRGVRVYSLPDLERQPDLFDPPDRVMVGNLLAGVGGTAWITCLDFALEKGVLYRVGPEGQVTAAGSLPGIGPEKAESLEHISRAAVATDGSLWLTLQFGPVFRYRDGILRRFDWHDGLIGGRVHQLLPGNDGRMYVLRDSAVLAFDPSVPPGPLPAGFELWDEYKVTYRQLIYDPRGNIWLFRRDRLGQASKWDGIEWQHVPVPFETDRVFLAVGDDRGHLVVGARDADNEMRGYDVGPSGVERFPSFDAALAAAVEDGARSFVPDRDMRGCVVLDGPRIWYGHGPAANYYANGRWDAFRMRNVEMGAWESVRNGVLLGKKSDTWYTYDTGQIVPAEFPDDISGRYLLGPHGPQPFEWALLRSYPDRYLPVQAEGRDRYRILVPADGHELEPAGLLPHYARVAVPMGLRGFWLGSEHDLRDSRVLGGHVVECDFADSPLDGRTSKLRRATIDRAGNLWLDFSGYGGTKGVFVKRTEAFHLVAHDMPEEAGRSLRAEIRVSEPGVNPDDFHLFWRFRGDAWQEAPADEPILVRFMKSGRYELEFLAMDPHGATSGAPLRHVVRAEFALPDTVLVEGEPLRSRDVFWRPPVRAVPSEDGEEPVLFWRMEGGEWQRLSEAGVSFGGQEPGEYALEFVAREEELYADPSPLHVRVEYAPDYQFIVESRLAQLTSHEHKRRQRAIDAIKAAGPEVVSILKEKLQEAREAARRAGILQTLVRELEPQPEAPTAPTPSSHVDFRSAVPSQPGEQGE